MDTCTSEAVGTFTMEATGSYCLESFGQRHLILRFGMHSGRAAIKGLEAGFSAFDSDLALFATA